MKKDNVTKKKREATRLRLILNDNSIKEFPYAWQTLAYVIITAGLDNVMELLKSDRGNPILSRARLSDTQKAKNQKEIAPGYFLYTKSGTDEKYAIIDFVRKELNLDWIKEIQKVKK